MQYLGGKSRIAKDIARVILELTDDRQHYVEPFVGAGSVAAELAPHFTDAVLSDASPDLIELWRALQDGWTPPASVSKEEYQEQRYAPVSALRGFVGYGCSFGGKWFGGYAANNDGRNYARTGGALLAKRIIPLKAATLYNLDYRDLVIPDGAVVYCDPPYRNATKYDRLADFDSDEFWKVAESWSERSTVFVSEYEAPEGWRSVWQAKPRVTLRKDTNDCRSIEHLWVYDKPRKQVTNSMGYSVKKTVGDTDYSIGFTTLEDFVREYAAIGGIDGFIREVQGLASGDATEQAQANLQSAGLTQPQQQPADPWAGQQAAPPQYSPQVAAGAPAQPPQQASPACQHGPLRVVPGGVSKRTGAAYGAFWACPAPRGQQCRLDKNALPPVPA